MQHPNVGELRLRYDKLAVADAQLLIIYHPIRAAAASERRLATSSGDTIR
jgi:hypothetical protein